MIVPKVTTTPTQEEFVKAMNKSLTDFMGQEPISTLAIAILFAQFAFETGWGKYCFNYNLGNVRKMNGDGWAGDVFGLPSAWEIIDGKRVVTGGQFRSFLSLQHGADEHVYFLAHLHNYAPAWELIMAACAVELSELGDDAATVAFYGRRFVERLKAGHYFTGDLEEYVHGVVSIALAFVRSHSISQEVITAPASPQAFNYRPQDGADAGAFTAMQALEFIFDKDWQAEQMAAFLNCRYDCQEAA